MLTRAAPVKQGIPGRGARFCFDKKRSPLTQLAGSSIMSRKLLLILFTSTFVFGVAAWIWIVPMRIAYASNACVNNLRQIEGAKEQWALENVKTTNDVPSWDDIRPYVGRGTEGDLSGLRCQKGGTYTIGRVGPPPTCSMGGVSGEDHPSEYTSKNIYGVIVGSVCVVSFLGLLVVLIVPKKVRDQDHPEAQQVEDNRKPPSGSDANRAH